jgi:hypothetical protein
MHLEYTMPSRKNRTMKKRGKKGTSKQIYKQVGCAKRNKKQQKGGSAMGTMHAGNGAPVLFSKTMYPYDTTGGAANPMDARQTQMGGSRRKRYSRKYYKQSGGAPYSFLVGPANYADQPINDKYTDSNPFRI